MTIRITDAATGNLVAGTVTLTEAAPTLTRSIILTNGYAQRLTSLKLYLLNENVLPGQRSVTVAGIPITGTSEETATEVLSAPLEPGGTLSGEEVFSVTGPLTEGYDPATLHWLALPEV